MILKLCHEQHFRIMKTDPISGHDVDNHLDHCSLIDGSLMIYFDREEHRKTFKDMPFSHPDLRLPFPASNDDGRDG